MIIITQFILQQAIIFITSAVNVYIRDAEYILNFFINMLFYATPILYSASMFENSPLRFVIYLNPMATIINCYRDILFYQSMPRLKSLLIVLFASCILFMIGLKVFRKLEKGFAEEV